METADETGEDEPAALAALDDDAGLGAAAASAELRRGLGQARRQRLLASSGGPLNDATLALIIAHVADGVQAPLVVVAPDDARLAGLGRDLRFFLRDAGAAEGPLATPPVWELPSLEMNPWADVAPDRRAIARRMATLFRLSQGLAPRVLLVSAAGLMRKVMPRAGFAALVDVVQRGEEIDRDRTTALLAQGGYTRMPVVEDPGTFAVRGGVVDVFPPLYRFPLRIELDFERVESLKYFDPETQRTMREIDEVYLHPVRETVPTPGHRLRERLLEVGDHVAHPSSKTRAILEQVERGEDFFGVEALAPAFHASLTSLGEYLPEQPRWFIDDPDAVAARAREEWQEGEAAYAQRVDEHRLAFAPGEHYLDAEELRALIERGARIEAPALEVYEPGGVEVPTVRLAASGNRGLQLQLERARAERHEELLAPLVRHIAALGEHGYRVVLTALNGQHADRLASLLAGYQLTPHIDRRGERDLGLDLLAGGGAARPAPCEIVIGHLGHGFVLPHDRLAVVGEAEIFGDKALRRAPRDKKKSGLPHADRSLANLEVGAFVVHKLHGVGAYRGLAKIPLKAAGRQQIAVDFLHLEYDGGALYLPVWRVDEVQPFAGAEGVTPKLDKLGGLTWDKTRSKVKREVRQLAEELLQLYAQRRSQPGVALGLSAEMEQIFREFEATFPFEETPDQERAIMDVLDDLDKAHPMDRLVCGDVGYGKTEVALRAAVKCALAGKQVAFLAPTTVLVEQHALTMAARFAKLPILPVKVAAVSRFKDKAELTQTLKGLADGTVDIVVGTHRLLSADVRFRDLGLLIIDEEQRFGVAHKEKIKKLKTQVDVLTMSATPIPRTLHMAMMGLRDLSAITTPPADRLAIRTVVAKRTDALITEGVRRELARGGQIFFVHNRIEDLDELAAHLREILPEVRIVIGHGQMASEALEKVMVDFVDGRADVLLCTTIIESGLDIPRANTMFVDRADCYGLAQLYQLRGRIGRARERAFCYLLIPGDDKSLSGDAKMRLQVLQRFTELGAGFQIASHDLELRGAGDLLGARQSGMIAAVGFETYMQLLDEATASLRGEPITEELDPDITCDLPGFIPDDYLPDVGQRLEHYRRLSGARDEGEVRELMRELSDRYGPPPPEVELLAGVMVCKSLARRLRVKALELSESRLALTFAAPAVARAADDVEAPRAELPPSPLSPEHVVALLSPGAFWIDVSPGVVADWKKADALRGWRVTSDERLERPFTEGEAASQQYENRVALARGALDALHAFCQAPPPRPVPRSGAAVKPRR